MYWCSKHGLAMVSTEDDFANVGSAFFLRQYKADRFGAPSTVGVVAFGPLLFVWDRKLPGESRPLSREWLGRMMSRLQYRLKGGGKVV